MGHFLSDKKIKIHLPVLTDDVFDIVIRSLYKLNQIEAYLYACDWQKAEIKYSTVLPEKCRKGIQETLTIGYSIVRYPKYHYKDGLKFVNKLA